MVVNSTERRKLFEPLRAKIVLKTRELTTKNEGSKDPSTHDSADENIHLSPLLHDVIETANSQRSNGFVQNAEFDGEPTDYEHSSRLETRIILSRQTIKKRKIVPEPYPVIAKRSCTLTRYNGRQKPYNLQKRTAYGRISRDHGCDDGVASDVRGRNGVSVEEKILPTRRAAADLVVRKLKPVYSAGLIDKTKFKEIAESITANSINQNYDLGK